MDSKLTKLIQIRCVWTKKWFKKILAFLVSVVLQPRGLRGVSMLRKVLSSCWPEWQHCIQCPTDWTRICWLVLQVHNALPQIFPPAPWFRISAMSDLPWAEFAGSSGVPKITGLEPGTEATRAKAKFRIVSRSLWHIPSGVGRVCGLLWLWAWSLPQWEA